MVIVRKVELSSRELEGARLMGVTGARYSADRRGTATAVDSWARASRGSSRTAAVDWCSWRDGVGSS